jgi:hypothetical protein
VTGSTQGGAPAAGGPAGSPGGGVEGAVAARGLSRATLGAAAGGVLLGMFALAVLATGPGLTAGTLPAFALLALGQAGGLTAAAACAVRLAAVRRGRPGAPAAAAAARSLDLLVPTLAVSGLGLAVLTTAVAETRAVAAFSAVVGLALLAQLLVLLVSLRRPLRRASRWRR